MKNFLRNNLKIIFPSIISLILVSFIWDKINFKFYNPKEIIGYYSIFKYSPLNDNIRYILFIGLPLLTYLFSYFYFNKLNFNSFKNAFIFEKNKDLKNNIFLNLLFIFIFLIIILSVSKEFNSNPMDLFHEGQALSGAFNYKITNELWSKSFVITSLFVDILNANIAWNLFDTQNLSSYRLYIHLLNTLTTIVILIFIFNIVNASDLEKNFKNIFFILFSFFIFSYSGDVSYGYRELPIFIFLLFTYKFFKTKKINFINCFIIGILPLVSLFWSLDRGLFMIVSYLPFLLILIFNKRVNEILLIFIFSIISILTFYFIVGSYEFNHFISNSFDIIKSSDLLNGIKHPTPFTNDSGSSRATKNLLFIILNGIILINYVFNKKQNLNKNLIIFFLIYYFISIIFYKIGLTRSDGGHIKQGGSLNLILLIYFIFYNILFFLNNKILISNLKPIFFKSFNLSIILIFFFSNLPKNFLGNTLFLKKRIYEYINTQDEKYLKKNEIYLIKELSILTKNEKCFQVFSYETAISYFLKKSSCTKFYHIMNMGPKKNQLSFIEELENSNPQFMLIGGSYENIGNIKGRDIIELSPSDRFPYIQSFLLDNYKTFKKIDNWEILIKNE